MDENAQQINGPSPEQSGLDSDAWLRLGAMAQATQARLQTSPPRVSPSAPSQEGPGLWGQIGIATLDALKRDWNRIFHPIQSLKAWWATVMERMQPVPTPSAPSPGSTTPDSDPPKRPPDGRPTLDHTWTAVRDQLFDAAQNPASDPQKVADAIVSGIPEEHKAAMVERLTALSEMAQHTARSLQHQQQHATSDKMSEVVNRPPLGDPPPEVEQVEPIPDNLRLFKKPPVARQVPPQPLPESPKSKKRPPSPASKSQPHVAHR